MLANQAKIESLIFVSGNEGITVTEIAHLTGLLKPAVLEQLEKLKQKYQSDQSCGLMLLCAEERYRLATKKPLATLVKSYFETDSVVKLSAAALETLAIIAYQQPVTRVDIDEIRGVKSSSMLQKLLLLGLIAEAGRLELPGRPLIYVTTEAFLDYFGITTLADLPELPKIQDEKSEELEVNDYLELFETTITEEID
ncbi:SMC-Scp complex subunit ScpB [Ligilactobacillus ceti]|uniref:Segregation and condensation protein B n=1 Tax=Ligilactobacillus ceti DSM 22408 TaxID=1122146 RepID=A0A0R2KRT8_9LACO|nr:SMC-Scp complex subunit ScpB [Ligilactobacillus ceti]KRN88893.1 segregation and condensation protein ScpB [Ligilactobacillus ceti DSM 22408]